MIASFKIVPDQFLIIHPALPKTNPQKSIEISGSVKGRDITG
jgi:hypothetical protein